MIRKDIADFRVKKESLLVLAFIPPVSSLSVPSACCRVGWYEESIDQDAESEGGTTQDGWEKAEAEA